MTGAARRGMVVILAGPSGSGKSTICARLLAEADCDRSVSVTTRAPRPGERNGREYWFTDREDFLKKAKEGHFAESAEYCGHLYGTPLRPLQEAVAKGRLIFLVIEVDGARQIKEKMPDALRIFVRAPSAEEAQRRLEGRDTAAADIAQRQERARYEMAQADEFDYVIVNDDLDAAVRRAREIIAKEREARFRSGESSGAASAFGGN